MNESQDYNEVLAGRIVEELNLNPPPQAELPTWSKERMMPMFIPALRETAITATIFAVILLIAILILGGEDRTIDLSFGFPDFAPIIMILAIILLNIVASLAFTYRAGKAVQKASTFTGKLVPDGIVAGLATLTVAVALLLVLGIIGMIMGGSGGIGSWELLLGIFLIYAYASAMLATDNLNRYLQIVVFLPLIVIAWPVVVIWLIFSRFSGKSSSSSTSSSPHTPSFDDDKQRELEAARQKTEQAIAKANSERDPYGP